MKRPVKIFIADDHRLMLEGLATLIQSIHGLQLTGKFYSGTDLLDALAKAKELPDICLVDIEMPGMDGIETVKIIREKFGKLKVMALTMHDESHFVSRMIRAGANGYLLKNIDRAVFENSIHRVLRGEGFITEGTGNHETGTPADELSPRERQVLRLIVNGKNNKEISEELFISARTADTHRTNIKKKLKLSSLALLMKYARDHGYFS